MDRYKFSIKEAGRYLTSRMPVIPIQPDDEYIITREGDRLDVLAYEFYEDASFWWLLANANNLRSASLVIPAGIQLRIPKNLDYLGRQLEAAEKDK